MILLQGKGMIAVRIYLLTKGAGSAQVRALDSCHAKKAFNNANECQSSKSK
jgi:hypothetical protein